MQIPVSQRRSKANYVIIAGSRSIESLECHGEWAKLSANQSWDGSGRG